MPALRVKTKGADAGLMENNLKVRMPASWRITLRCGSRPYGLITKGCGSRPYGLITKRCGCLPATVYRKVRMPAGYCLPKGADAGLTDKV